MIGLVIRLLLGEESQRVSSLCNRKPGSKPMYVRSFNMDLHWCIIGLRNNSLRFVDLTYTSIYASTFSILIALELAKLGASDIGDNVAGTSAYLRTLPSTIRAPSPAPSRRMQQMFRRRYLPSGSLIRLFDQREFVVANCTAHSFALARDVVREPDTKSDTQVETNATLRISSACAACYRKHVGPPPSQQPLLLGRVSLALLT